MLRVSSCASSLLFGGASARGDALHVAAIEHEPGHALRMTLGVGDGDGAALREPEQRKAIEAGGVHHGLEVAHPGLERQILRVAVGEAGAALVVAQERVVSARARAASDARPDSPNRIRGA
jgi:hypothetical protein